MSVIHTPQERQLDARLLAVPALLTLVVIAYWTRLWFLQVVTANDLQERAAISGQVAIKRLAPRGKIVDRTGKVLAGVRPSIVVMAQPKTALANPEAIGGVASLLGVPPDKLEKAIKNVAYAVNVQAPVYVGADISVASRILDDPARYPGFGIQTQAMRYYDCGAEMGHLMGYVRTPRDVDLKRLKADGVAAAQYVGIQGLERKYERELMGRAGQELSAVDARGRTIRDLGTDEPYPGSTLVLSLDHELQSYAMSQLQGRQGSIVMLDPSTGEVLCMASSPSFDASIFLSGISKDDYKSVAEDPARPLFFRAAAGAYAPGSTFKILTTLAAFQTGKFSESSSAYCPGYLKMGSKKFKCLGHHGTVTYTYAFTKSCNVYFGELGLKVGSEALIETCAKAGIGRPTGLDLPIEASGVVPTAQWWAKHRDRRFAMGDTVNLSVGQGELTVTPLQMASLASLVANEGVSYKPHLVRAIVGPQEGAKPVPREKQVLGKIDATPQQWAALKRAMRYVITSGTARSAQVSGLDWGGKTGSAENRKDRQTHSWFVGIAPVNGAKVAICVMVENAGHGGDVAAPIAANMVRHFFQKRPAAKPTIEIQSSRSAADTDSSRDNPAVSPAER